MSSQKFLKGNCQLCGGSIEFPAEAVGTATTCPHCGQTTELLLAAPLPESGLPVKTIMYTGLAIVILAGGLVGAMLALKRAQALMDRNKTTPTQAAPKPALPPGTILKDGFRISPIRLEKNPDSSLIHAVGTVRNETNRRRFGVRIELDVLDTTGQKVGTAKDYQQVLEPGADWRLNALVVGSKAAAAKFASMTEDK